MTTTQPAALPERIAHVEDWPDDRTPIGLVWDVDPASVPVGTKLYALAALQPQPAAAVSDAQIMGCIAEHEVYQGRPGALLHFARAILALRPQAVPMSRDDLKVLMSAAGYVHATAQEKADFINGFRNAEAFGITAQGAQGGEGE